MKNKKLIVIIKNVQTTSFHKRMMSSRRGRFFWSVLPPEKHFYNATGVDHDECRTH